MRALAIAYKKGDIKTARIISIYVMDSHPYIFFPCSFGASAAFFYFRCFFLNFDSLQLLKLI